MATNTYVALGLTTVSSATSSVTINLSGISGYKDLVLVGNAKAANNASLALQFNGDTGSNYSYQVIDGDGTTAAGNRQSNTAAIQAIGWSIAMGSTTNWSCFTANIMNYSNSSTFKPVLIRSAAVNTSNAMGTDLFSGVWRNTAAITSITVLGNTISAGSTFAIYGIKTAATGAMATGGIILSDETYWYHVFTSTGTFTPSVSLTADILQIAGGGAGGRYYGGGGGAGGVSYVTSQSLTAVGYTCTVGAGGAGQTGGTLNSAKGNNGNNSQFGSLTAAVAGGAGGTTGTNNTGNNGGSGGGGTYNNGAGGTATAGQGNAGGLTTAGAYGGAGGGGAGGAGGPFNTNGGANQSYGGVGTTAYSSWGLATGTGQNVNGTVYYAGGGAGNPQANNGIGGYGGGGSALNLSGYSTAGMIATGGGGSNKDSISTAGGSGIIIVRYLK
jgi:hypothetical protein